MAADLVVEGGLVVDGTGAPAYRADVAIRDGVIVGVAPPGSLGESGRRIDADGLVVAPGFIDIHTHLDAQVFWDPACSQSLLHGVTTAIGGNCGFSVAPLSPDDDGYMMRLLSSVEEIPLESLEQGVSWQWQTTADYLASVEAAQPVVNMGFLVGHSALRRAVMLDDAVGGAPTAAQLESMSRLLEQSLRAGGLGFSSSWNTVHFDGDGSPVPSRSASEDELIALCRVVRDVPGTQVEFIPPISAQPAFDARRVELLTNMSLAADRALNWNVFMPRSDQACQSQLRASEEAAAAGARVLALSYPGILRARRSFANSRVFTNLFGLSNQATSTEQAALLSAVAARQRLRDFALVTMADGSLGIDAAKVWGMPGSRPDICAVGELMVLDTASQQLRRYEGRRLSDLGAEVGKDPFDLLCDLAIADELRTGFSTPLRGADISSWRIRDESWRSPYVVLGASDAGAHVQTLSSFDWATTFLDLNRRRQILGLEQAVHLVTGRQAELYGLRSRGRIAEGWAADITVFDAESIAPEPARWTEDLPGSAARLLGRATGLEHVIVNGVEVLRAGELTGHGRGKVLRSGIDTVTVPLPRR
jgi:N-acyl-D-aspartate/D-glutamate deacylase